MAAKVYSYIRVSSPEQAKSGSGLKRQMEDTAKWAAERGMALDTSLRLRDEGKSGFHGAHRDPGAALRRFLDAVDDGRVERGSILVIENLDRLSREDVDEQLVLFLSLTAKGVTIVTQGDGQTYNREVIRSNPAALMLSIAIMFRANEESRVKQRRLVRSWEDKRAGEKPLTPVCPGWLKLNKASGQFVFREERAAVVRRIFALIIGGMGKGAVAALLNDEGIPNFRNDLKSKRGKSGWHASAVDKIVHWRACIGEFQPHRLADPKTKKRVPVGEARPGYFPAVVDEETYWRAQAAMASRSVGGGRPTVETYGNLFGGVAKCECGSPMHYRNRGSTTKSGGAYLSCSAASRKVRDADGRTRCVNTKGIRYTDFENQFLDCIVELDLSAPESGEHARVSAALDAKGAERDGLKKRIARLVAMIEEGDEIAEVWRERKAELAAVEADIERLKAALAGCAPEEGPQARQDALRRLWAEMATSEPGDLYRLRAALAAAIRGLDVEVTFSADETASVRVGEESFYLLYNRKATRELRAKVRAALAAA